MGIDMDWRFFATKKGWVTHEYSLLNRCVDCLRRFYFCWRIFSIVLDIKVFVAWPIQCQFTAVFICGDMWWLPTSSCIQRISSWQFLIFSSWIWFTYSLQSFFNQTRKRSAARVGYPISGAWQDRRSNSYNHRALNDAEDAIEAMRQETKMWSTGSWVSNFTFI